jgi:inosose dehydratase
MMPTKLRFACHLITWGGEPNQNPEKVIKEVADAGYTGIESLPAKSPEQLIEMAALAGKYNLHVVNTGGPSPEDAIKYNVTLGNKAAEVPGCGRGSFGGANPTGDDFRRAGESMKSIIAFAQEHNIKPFHHAHLGTMIETVEDAEKMIKAAPGLYLLFDTGHLSAARSNAMRVFDKLSDKIAHVHLKDFTAKDPKTWNHRTDRWGEDGRFEELGKGNMGLDVKAILKGLENIGFDGWVSVEQDQVTHHNPAETAIVNMEYIKSIL